MDLKNIGKNVVLNCSVGSQSKLGTKPVITELKQNLKNGKY